MQFQDRNNTTTLWRQGIYTHTQAGRSDFLERARFARLFEAVFQIVNKLRACGIVDLDFLQGLYHSIDELNRGIRHPLTYQTGLHRYGLCLA